MGANLAGVGEATGLELPRAGNDENDSSAVTGIEGLGVITLFANDEVPTGRLPLARWRLTTIRLGAPAGTSSRGLLALTGIVALVGTMGLASSLFTVDCEIGLCLRGSKFKGRVGRL